MIAGWFFLVFITAYLPYAAIKQAKRLKSGKLEISRKDAYLSIYVNQAVFLVLSLVVAWSEDIVLFPVPKFGWISLWLSLAFLVPTIVSIPLRWKWKSKEERTQAAARMPTTPNEVLMWVFVSLAAGIVEEITYRGVAMQLWQEVIGSWWPAAIVCSLAFAIVHAHQGAKAVLVIVPMAVANHLIVRATGDLYTMMAIHFAYDVIAGLYIAHLAKKDGLQPSLPEVRSESP